MDPEKFYKLLFTSVSNTHSLISDPDILLNPDPDPDPDQGF
jgi:hypothetical protein